ncbi:anti-adapter protein IraM [unidentified bacterial endosymbiont]|jgi:anti-adapter protein IraM|uniref:anti-adapter protein IraM n=1 Tax=unidentified bacterial endosymbiont TaxID=2355 RepID=UPI00209CAB62|nr:anti-adapter protein IraM [unidentified bacterial endosymbiont]
MKWTVIDTLVCPATGIMFTSIVSVKMLKLVIWYKGSVILRPGATVEPFRDSLAVDGKYVQLTIYNITPFNRQVWEMMRGKMSSSLKSGHNPK